MSALPRLTRPTRFTPLAHYRRLAAELTAAAPGARVVKSGLAVALVWALGQALGQQRPMFAVFAALGVIQPTIRSSAINLAGQLGGVLVGSVLALAMAGLFGAPQAATVGLAVVASLALGYRFGSASGSLAPEVVGTTMLTVAFANGQPSWTAERLCEVAGGGALAVLINALVFPPDYLADVKASVHRLADGVCSGARQAIEDLVHRPSREEVRGHLAAARASRSYAESVVASSEKALEALRFSPVQRLSPMRRDRGERTQRYAAGVHVLAGALDHTRTAQRAVWQARRRPALDSVEGSQWLPLGEALTRAIRAFESYIIAGDAASQAQARQALDAVVDLHTRALARHAATSSGAVWAVDQAAVLSEIEHILEDLAGPLRVELPSTSASTRPLLPVATG